MSCCCYSHLCASLVYLRSLTAEGQNDVAAERAKMQYKLSGIQCERNTAASTSTAESQAASMAWRPLKPEQGQTGLSGQGSYIEAISNTAREKYCHPNRTSEGGKALPQVEKLKVTVAHRHQLGILYQLKLHLLRTSPISSCTSSFLLVYRNIPCKAWPARQGSAWDCSMTHRTF